MYTGIRGRGGGGKIILQIKDKKFYGSYILHM